MIDWADWRPATCMPDACFCEAIRDGLVRQPANTWSCLAFVAVGLLVLRQTFRAPSAEHGIHASNLLTTRPTYGLLYATALILIGVGSGFYHASLSFWGQFFDVFGMYLLGTFILLYNLSRLHRLSEPTVAALYVTLNAVLAVALYTVPELRRYAFGVLLITALALEIQVRRRFRPMADGKLLGFALLSIVVGFVIWIADITRTVCDSTSIVQGHAVWHVVGAVAAWFLYRYYRSDGTALV